MVAASQPPPHAPPPHAPPPHAAPSHAPPPHAPPPPQNHAASAAYVAQLEAQLAEAKKKLAESAPPQPYAPNPPHAPTPSYATSLLLPRPQLPSRREAFHPSQSSAAAHLPRWEAATESNDY